MRRASVVERPKETIGVFANLLRRNIQKLSNTSQEFSKLSTFIRTQNLLNKSIAQLDRRLGIGLTDIVVGGGGFAGAGLPGALGVVGAKKVAESPIARTFAAVNLNRLNKAIQSIPVDSAGKVSKIAILNLLKSFTSASFPESNQ